VDRHSAQGLTEAARVSGRLPQRLGSGRVLARPSGAEPLVRVMAEASTQDDVDAVCSRIVAVVEEHLPGRLTVASASGRLTCSEDAPPHAPAAPPAQRPGLFNRGWAVPGSVRTDHC